jgi:hypothetical protein
VVVPDFSEKVLNALEDVEVKLLRLELRCHERLIGLHEAFRSNQADFLALICYTRTHSGQITLKRLS